MNIVPDMTLDEFLADDDSQTRSREDGGTLRKKLEDALSILREQNAELTKLRTERAETVLSQTWDELDVPQAIRKLYQGEKTADAIKAWWEDSRSLFNLQSADETPSETETEKARREQYQQVQGASAIGADTNVSGLDAALAKGVELKDRAGATTQADRDAFYRLAGIPKY